MATPTLDKIKNLYAKPTPVSPITPATFIGPVRPTSAGGTPFEQQVDLARKSQGTITQGKTPLHDEVRNYLATIAPARVATSMINDLADKATDFALSTTKPTATSAERAVKFGRTALSAATIPFYPVMAILETFKGVKLPQGIKEKSPVYNYLVNKIDSLNIDDAHKAPLKSLAAIAGLNADPSDLAQLLESGFTFGTQGITNLVNKGLNKLPIKQQTRELIAPLVEDASNLLGVLALGELGGVVLKGIAKPLPTEIKPDLTIEATPDAIAKDTMNAIANTKARATNVSEQIARIKEADESSRAMLKITQDNPTPKDIIAAKVDALKSSKTEVGKLAINESAEYLLNKVSKQEVLKAEYESGTPLSKDVKTRVAERFGREVPKEVTVKIDTTKYTPESKKVLEAFDKSTKQTKIGDFELGSFGRNSAIRKTTLGDRFPEGELNKTVKNISEAYRASSNPTNYRYDNIAHIAKMPDGETRAIYTRLNANGKEEIINWHTISKPEYLADIRKNGIPDGTRTRTISLEGRKPVQLTDRDNLSIAQEGETVKPIRKLAVAKPKIVEAVKIVPTEKVKVPSEQLPVGEKGGKVKISRLEQRVKASLNNAPDEVRELSTYSEMNKDAQINKASQYVAKNPDEALAVLRGDKEPPKGLLKNSIYIAMSDLAVGDMDLATKLTTLSATRSGQELSILTELNPNSPVKWLSNLKERKIEVMGGLKKIKETYAKEVGKLKEAIKESVPKLDTWEKFLTEITCK